MCLSTKMYVNILLFFCAGWDNFSSENILYVIT